MDRCEYCRKISNCTVCSKPVSGFYHIGVRAATFQRGKITGTTRAQGSGIWHYARPCGHKTQTKAATANLQYNGGPVWKNGYTWQNLYWGPYFTTPSSTPWVKNIEQATLDIELDNSYSGGLSQYNVGTGKFTPPVMIKTAPPSTLSDIQIQQALTSWIGSGTVAKLGTQGAYNIFMPPGTIVSLSGDVSCSTFCDYHNSVNGSNGPFYTVEPYPCANGCNQCTNNPLDTLTQGLSEEMIELKTDMDPGTGWVIGNLELCDFCDANFVCNRISTGEYVNSWYDKNNAACWIGTSMARNLGVPQTETGQNRTRISQ